MAAKVECIKGWQILAELTEPEGRKVRENCGDHRKFHCFGLSLRYLGIWKECHFGKITREAPPRTKLYWIPSPQGANTASSWVPQWLFWRQGIRTWPALKQDIYIWQTRNIISLKLGKCKMGSNSGKITMLLIATSLQFPMPEESNVESIDHT